MHRELLRIFLYLKILNEIGFNFTLSFFSSQFCLADLYEADCIQNWRHMD
jgi:hypothetical protein